MHNTDLNNAWQDNMSAAVDVRTAERGLGPHYRLFTIKQGVPSKRKHLYKQAPRKRENCLSQQFVLSDGAEPTSDLTKTLRNGKSAASLGCLGGLRIT